MPKAIYTDRDYLDAKFKGLESKIDEALEIVPAVVRLQEQMRFQRRLLSIALGVTGTIGIVISWGVDIAGDAAQFIKALRNGV